MKLVVLSYSHHGRSMAQTAHALGHDIVGVMDSDAAPRQQLMDDFQCPGFAEAGTCLDASKPDAALVAGKHIEMPSHVQACVDRRIPYLLDKPFADCADRLRPAAEASEKHGGVQRAYATESCEPNCQGGSTNGRRWQFGSTDPCTVAG